MSHQESPPPVSAETSLPAAGRYIILICAFLGWMCAGFHMAITSLAMQPAAIDLLARTGQLNESQYRNMNKQVQARGKRPAGAVLIAEEVQFEHWKELTSGWFAWLQCAFLFGAASGGLFFGRLGDHIGRSKAMALSILTYSAMAAAGSLAQTPTQLLVIWYLACTGLGGMWPNGVALLSEVLSSMSRTMAAGLIGTAANVGIFLMSTLASNVPASPKSWPWVTKMVATFASFWPLGSDPSYVSWRWMFVVGSLPLVLGIFALLAVPESPRWLASRRKQLTEPSTSQSTWDVFRPPLLKVTLVGIALATVPMIGGWGSANWMVPWADEAGAAADPPISQLKANVQQARSLTGIVGSLLGGWIGSLVGRRLTYFLVSFFALGIAQYTFWFVVPTDGTFLYWVAALGFFSGIYFGWMPLFLPELFPTRVRSTGAGVSFNFGRILTAVTVFATGALTVVFKGDYAQIGRATSLIFAFGMLAICLTPETDQKQLAE